MRKLGWEVIVEKCFFFFLLSLLLLGNPNQTRLILLVLFMLEDKLLVLKIVWLKMSNIYYFYLIKFSFDLTMRLYLSSLSFHVIQVHLEHWWSSNSTRLQGTEEHGYRRNEDKSFSGETENNRRHKKTFLFVLTSCST